MSSQASRGGKWLQLKILTLKNQWHHFPPPRKPSGCGFWLELKYESDQYTYWWLQRWATVLKWLWDFSVLIWPSIVCNFSFEKYLCDLKTYRTCGFDRQLLDYLPVVQGWINRILHKTPSHKKTFQRSFTSSRVKIVDADRVGLHYPQLTCI